MKKNRFRKCYMLFAMIAAKQQGLQFSKQWNKNGMTLIVMIVKELLKLEFGIKSMAELDKKRLQEFEEFLEKKL